ncbi:MAG: hypothetical protein H6Q97_758, partial [Nitrospirae bacterium]|nr:hypothetical protein [Nitrospirota bacterium]
MSSVLLRSDRLPEMMFLPSTATTTPIRSDVMFRMTMPYFSPFFASRYFLMTRVPLSQKSLCGTVTRVIPRSETTSTLTSPFNPSPPWGYAAPAAIMITARTADSAYRMV